LTSNASTPSSAANRHFSGNNSAPLHHPVRSYFAIAAATLFWGISATLGRAVFTGRLISGAPSAVSAIDPLILTQSRTTISLLALAPLLLLLRGRRSFAMPGADIGRCLLVGILGVACSNYFYYVAIQKTTVATAIILQYTAPIWVLLYMVARRLQRASFQRVAAVALGVVGSALAIGLAGGAQIKINALGVGAALLAALGFSFYNIGGRELLQKYDRWPVFLYTLLGSVLVWNIVNPPWKIVQAHYSAEQWWFLLLFAVLSILIPYSLYFAGLQYLDPTRAIVTSCLEPVFSILIAAIFLSELLTGLQVAGVVIVLAATVLVQMGPPPERKRRLDSSPGSE